MPSQEEAAGVLDNATIMFNWDPSQGSFVMKKYWPLLVSRIRVNRMEGQLRISGGGGGGRR